MVVENAPQGFPGHKFTSGRKAKLVNRRGAAPNSELPFTWSCFCPTPLPGVRLLAVGPSVPAQIFGTTIAAAWAHPAARRMPHATRTPPVRPIMSKSSDLLVEDFELL